MFDRNDMTITPNKQMLSEYVQNPLWDQMHDEIEREYQTSPVFEYSKCSWEHGWNVKFKKRGKSLCTLYPYQNYFIVLVVIGKKEKISFESILPSLSEKIQKIYKDTPEGNNQRWLMMTLSDYSQTYEDVKKIISIRAKAK